MQLSAQEERLVRRHRSIGWKLFRIGRSFCALIGLGAIVWLTTLVVQQRVHRQEYQRQIESLRLVSATDSLPDGIAPVQGFDSPLAFATDHIGRYQSVIDSLGINADILGLQFTVMEMPIGVSGYREYLSSCDLFTQCGCDQDGYFDLLQMEIDPHRNSVRVVASEKPTTRAEYLTLNRHVSGTRR